MRRARRSVEKLRDPFSFTIGNGAVSGMIGEIGNLGEERIDGGIEDNGAELSELRRTVVLFFPRRRSALCEDMPGVSSCPGRSRLGRDARFFWRVGPKENQMVQRAH